MQSYTGEPIICPIKIRLTLRSRRELVVCLGSLYVSADLHVDQIFLQESSLEYVWLFLFIVASAYHTPEKSRK